MNVFTLSLWENLRWGLIYFNQFIFFNVPWVGLLCVIEALPDHTFLLVPICKAAIIASLREPVSLTLNIQVDSSFWFTPIYLGCPLYLSRGFKLLFLKRILYYFVWKSFFTFTNSVDPDEMQHYAAFHLGLHCLQKYSFSNSPSKLLHYKLIGPHLSVQQNFNSCPSAVM